MSKKHKPKIKDLDLEIQYQLYLNKMKLDESKMHPVQRTETKNAFMAGAGQTLLLCREVIANIEDQDRAVLHLQDLLNQANYHFEQLVKRGYHTIKIIT